MTNNQRFVEDDYVAELTSRYESEGWKVVVPQQIPELTFQPDLLLHKNNEYLVVEVKRVGFASAKAVNKIRKAVEEKPNWHFELKLIPPGWGEGGRVPVKDDVMARLNVAQELGERGFASEAFILTWTVVEAFLRILHGIIENDGPNSTVDLLRKTYEDGIISNLELRQLEHGLQMRNRLVHGMAVRQPEIGLKDLLSLALTLATRAEDDMP